MVPLPDPKPLPLWPLPLLAGLLPAAAGLAALALSGLIPACNPFVDGCVSVSRAARHDLPNHVFRALVLPAAALQALTWLLAARWLSAQPGSATWPGLRALAPLGLLAGIALALYGAFLGTEGAVYRLLRQYGTVVYFGFTCLCMLIAGAAIERSAQATARPLPRLLQHALTALAVLLVMLGLVNALAGLWLDGEAKAQVENVAEWWGSLIFTLVFVALAAMWQHLGVQIGFAERER
jgi:hypothetical protein